MELKLTNEELEIIKYFREKAFANINQMLITDSRTDIDLLSNEESDEKITYDKENVIKYLETIKKVYKIMYSEYLGKGRKKDWKYYLISNVSEIQKLKNEPYIDKFLLLNSKEILDKKDLNLTTNQVIVNVLGDSEIPYIDLEEIFEDGKYEVLVSLFTKQIEVKESNEIKIGNKSVRTYNLKIEKQELQEMTSDDKVALYNYIISNSDLVNSTLISSMNLEEENINNYEEIRELEKQVSDLETEINNREVEGNYGESQKELDDINLEKLNKKLENLKTRSTEIFEEIKKNTKVVTDWKKNVTVYLMAECSDIQKDILSKMKEENAQELERVKNYEIKERIKREDLKKEKFAGILKEVQTECMDNDVLVKRLLVDIGKLITRQQYFAKIAGSMGASYSALNNSFEMKKNAEELQDLINTISLKVQKIEEDGESKENSETLLKISEVNNQITILINYLNNPKTLAVKQKINRFDEMIVVEENELKRNIAKAILDVRGEAELKKLRDDIKIIEDKGVISKFFGIFTGQNKLDDFMLDQIEIRQNSIKKTLAKKLRLDYNYSIHELLAEVRMFINDNKDDEIVAEDILVLKDLENEIKKNFVIIESKVNDIIEEKENKNLPIGTKLSKRELIEIETYRFLNKYGYDSGNKKEPKEAVYTDTTPKEIARISEYIRTSGIL